MNLIGKRIKWKRQVFFDRAIIKMNPSLDNEFYFGTIVKQFKKHVQVYFDNEFECIINISEGIFNF